MRPFNTSTDELLSEAVPLTSVSFTRQQVLAISSSGGHWQEVLRLRSAFDGHSVSFACTRKEYAVDTCPQDFDTVRDVNRFTFYRIPLVIYDVVRLLRRRRPTVVISTGALPGLIAILIARAFFGVRTIWIDSVANSEHISGSGKVAARLSHVCLVQWPDLTDCNRVEYWGSVL